MQGLNILQRLKYYLVLLKFRNIIERMKKNENRKTTIEKLLENNLDKKNALKKIIKELNKNENSKTK